MLAKPFQEILILLLLLIFVFCAPVGLLLVIEVNVLLQFVVSLLQLDNLFLEQPNLLVCLVLTFAQLTVLKCLVEKPLIPGNCDETWHHNCLLTGLVIAINGTLDGRLASNVLGFPLLKDEVLVDLENTVFFSYTV